MSAGWVLLHRGVWESPDFTPEPFSEREAFIWSITQAAFEPHLQWFNGVQYPVERGEFVTSSRKMAATFRWGDKRVRLFTARMVKRQKWAQRGAQEGAHGPTILSLCNYERFQAPAKAGGAANGTGKGAARAQLGRSEGAQQKEGINNSNEGEAISKASPSPALPYAEAVAIWVEFAEANGWKPSQPKLPLSDERRKMLGRTLATFGLDGWREGLERAASGEMLGGHDPPGWFHFTFAINPNNFVKISEGNYDKAFNDNAKPKLKQSAWGSINAQQGGSAGLHQQPTGHLLLATDHSSVAS